VCTIFHTENTEADNVNINNQHNS